MNRPMPIGARLSTPMLLLIVVPFLALLLPTNGSEGEPDFLTGGGRA
jgi:hypothetical protein